MMIAVALAFAVGFSVGAILIMVNVYPDSMVKPDCSECAAWVTAVKDLESALRSIKNGTPQ
jgi:hypothetical protein